MCECKGHPFNCHSHPNDCGCTDNEASDLTGLLSGWMPLTEQAPTIAKSYLVYLEHGGKKLLRTGIARWDKKNGVFCRYDTSRKKFVWLKATHWMPLPRPPAR